MTANTGDIGLGAAAPIDGSVEAFGSPSAKDAAVREKLIAAGVLRTNKLRASHIQPTNSDEPDERTIDATTAWAPEEPLRSARSAAVSSAGPGHTEIWVVLDSGRISHRWWTDAEARWSDWFSEELPYGAKASVIAAGSHGDWSHDILVVDTLGHLWHRWWTGAQWGEWQHNAMAAPSVHCEVSSAGPGHAEMWVVFDSGQIHHRWWVDDEGKWSPWASDQLPYGARASVIAAGSDSYWGHDVLVVDSHGQLWNRRWTGDRWSEWQHVPMPTHAIDCEVSSPINGITEMYVTLSTGELYFRSMARGGEWNVWSSHDLPDGVEAHRIAAVSNPRTAGTPEHDHELVLIDRLGDVWHLWSEADRTGSDSLVWAR